MDGEWQFAAVEIVGEDLVLFPVAVEIIIIEPDRFFLRCLQPAVQAEVAGDEVDFAIVVEIDRQDKVPPAFFVGKDFFCEVTVVIHECDDTAPFEAKQQIFLSVFVQVEPEGAGDEADMGKTGSKPVRHVGEMPGSVVLQQVRTGDLAIVIGYRSSADEEVRVSVAVEIEGDLRRMR